MDKLISVGCHFDLKSNTGTPCTEMYKVFSAAVREQDYFYEEKIKENNTALNLLPAIQRTINESDDPLYTALLAASNGNIIDVALCDAFSLENTMKEAMDQRFALSCYEEFLADLNCAETFSILTDNAGEIVLDALLCDYLQSWRCMRKLKPLSITFIVKGGPIFNDAMLEDAISAGCDKRGRIIDTGSNYIGCVLDRVSPKVKDVLRSSDPILAKGVANHENIYGAETFGKRVYDIFRIKCDPLSVQLNVPCNHSVFIKHLGEK